jgi:DNA-binding MarR family transcriptional regulator
LEQAGLISRTRDPKDERQVIISLTEKGTGMKCQVGTIMDAIGEATGCDMTEIANLLRDRLQQLKINLTAE